MTALCGVRSVPGVTPAGRRGAAPLGAGTLGAGTLGSAGTLGTVTPPRGASGGWAGRRFHSTTPPIRHIAMTPSISPRANLRLPMSRLCNSFQNCACRFPAHGLTMIYTFGIQVTVCATSRSIATGRIRERAEETRLAQCADVNTWVGRASRALRSLQNLRPPLVRRFPWTRSPVEKSSP